MAWHGPPGRELYYEDSGRGDAVVMMPGWGGSIADLGRLRRDLADGFRVVAVDLPGSGRSQPQPRYYTPGYYHQDAAVLLGLLDALGIGAAHLVGFSDGGEEALLMAALRPGCALSVFTWGAIGQIVASQADLDELAAVITSPSDALAPLAAYLTDAYGRANATVMTQTWSSAMRGILDAGGDISRSLAAQIRCPALLVAGTYDQHCSPGKTRELAEAIPRGQCAEAHDAGHDVHISHGDWLSATALRWCAGH
jgi:pimeloyl-ACP methyl ester carboxylesterase